MSYNLFIDDMRNPPLNDGKQWVIVRSSIEAMETVIQKGIPQYISFDHDLGGDDTSMKFIHGLIEYMIIHNLKLPEKFNYYAHSQNPVGVGNIESLMENVIEHFAS